MPLCLDKICRTCMSEAPALLSIYEKCLQQTNTPENCIQSSPSITEMLMSFTTLQFTKDDGLPENICLSCMSEINRAFSFKQKSERSESTLKSYLQQIISHHEAESHNTIKEECVTSTLTPTLPDLGEITELLKSEGTDIEVNDEAEEEIDVDDDETQIIFNDTNINDNDNMVDPNDENCSLSLDCLIVFECGLCSTQFQNKDDHKNHMVNDHLTYFCEICDLFFVSIDDYEKHQNSHENIIVETNECISEIDFNNLNTGDILETDNSNKKIDLKCLFCEKDFVHKKNFEKHLARYHPGEKLDKIENTVAPVLEHKEPPKIALRNNVPNKPQPELNIEMAPFKCNKCNARFAKERSLKLHHYSNKCTEISYPCDICNKVFAHRKNLLQHLVSHEEKKYKCPECPKEFCRQDRLTIHLQDHRGLKKHQCIYCGKGFNMLSTLKDHVRTHNGERPYLCSICGKGFAQSSNMKQHIMRHNKTKPYKCVTCNYSFVSKGELDAHLRKHTGDHPFVCDLCGIGFTTSSSLVKHKRIHTGEKPHACEYCPMRFTALGTLKNHRRTHTGERPFACKYCDKKFAQSSDMVSHTRTHTGERPHVCSACGLSFHQSSSLKNHLKSHQVQIENHITTSNDTSKSETLEKDDEF